MLANSQELGVLASCQWLSAAFVVNSWNLITKA
jgi:hypothetical protein